ncbi:MAG: hypothetical protein IJ727_07850 [Treponema sp.]|nr:hypothetical protein [Treponema sp.]
MDGESETQLTGIEKEMVLEYLMDGKAPLTLKVLESGGTAPVEKSPSFLFTLKSRNERPGKMEPEEGLLLNDREKKATFFLKKQVRVHFYFNKLALFFDSTVFYGKSGFNIKFPDVIHKVGEKNSAEKKSDFSLSLSYQLDGKNSDVDCDFDERFKLFRAYDFKDAVNGYLFQNDEFEDFEVFSGRFHAPVVIYFDSERIVFAFKKEEISLVDGSEYSLLLRFPLSGPVRERTVRMKCLVDQMFANYSRGRICAAATISSICEEDRRFLGDKVRR